MRLLLLPLIAACVLAAGCQGPPPTATPPTADLARRAASTLKLTAITGVVTGPVGRILSSNAAGVISANAGSYRLLAVEEAPLANVEVQLVDADGVAVPGLASVRTDAEGRYRIGRVPVGHTVIVQARAQAVGSDVPALLRTLVRTAEADSEGDVNAATTLVTAVLVDENRQAMGALDTQAFLAATRATASELKPSDLPDFTIPSAVKARMETLFEARQALKASLSEVRTELATVEDKIADIKEQVRQRDEMDRQPPTPPGRDEEASPPAAMPDRPDRPTPPSRPSTPPRGKPNAQAE